jgi:hypothetical protein
MDFIESIVALCKWCREIQNRDALVHVSKGTSKRLQSFEYNGKVKKVSDGFDLVEMTVRGVGQSRSFDLCGASIHQVPYRGGEAWELKTKDGQAWLLRELSALTC